MISKKTVIKRIEELKGKKINYKRLFDIYNGYLFNEKELKIGENGIKLKLLEQYVPEKDCILIGAKYGDKICDVFIVCDVDYNIIA